MTVFRLWLTPCLGALFSQGTGEHGMKVLLKLMEGIEHIQVQLFNSRTLAIRNQGEL